MLSIQKLCVALLAACTVMGCARKSTSSAGAASPQEALNESYLFITKKMEGIDFYATGQTPSWSLDMDLERSFVFRSNDGKYTLEVPATAVAQAQDANVHRYRSVTETAEMIITITSPAGEKSASGKKYAYYVQVEIKPSGDAASQRYQGTGMYLPDYRLIDIWALEQLHGRTVKADEYVKGIPTLEIQSESQLFTGNTGCNSLHGNLWTELDKIRFTSIVTTRVACPGTNESDFIQALNSARQFTIGNNRLNLLAGDSIVAVFRKVD